MRLTEFSVSGFRSVTDKINIRLRPEITCLIGANEHGKSNLLDAIALMTQGEFEEFDKSVGSYRVGDPNIVFTLQVNASERKRLLASIDDALKPPAPTDDAGKRARTFLDGVSKYYSAQNDTLQVSVLRNGTRTLTVPGVVNYTEYMPLGTGYTAPVLDWAQREIPRVLLFPAQDDLADSVTLEQLNERENLPFEGLLKLAQAWDNRDILFEDSVGARRRLDQAGKTLTRKIRQIWSQAASHTYRFDQTNGNLHLSIKDPVTFDTPSRRSLGFRSFLSFYLALFAETEEIAPEGFILLFDEPGIHLHPQGQKDLLAELRKLAKKNQIIYTSHSPFMIDRNDPANTILVYKGSTKTTRGTRINYKPWGANWSPLSGALGITAADAFFLPDKPLIVEGTSDKLYVAEYMRLLQSQTGADLNYLTMIDGDRREDVEGLLRILVGTERKFVVMIDGDPGGQQWANRLKKFAGERKAVVQIVDLGTFVPVKKPVSIEDILPADAWFSALQRYVSDVLGAGLVIDTAEIEQRAAGLTLGRAAAEYLVAKDVLAKPGDLSKTSVAHLYVQSQLAVPPAKSPMAKLCVELTRLLELDR
jgi:predicted ATPase